MVVWELINGAVESGCSRPVWIMDGMEIGAQLGGLWGEES
jgi:hypothetical protein